MSRRSAILAVAMLAVGIAAATVSAGKPAPVPSRLKIIVFPGAFNWPIWIAHDRSLGTEQNIEMTVTETRSSSEQMTGLVDGRYDIAMTAFDNVVAYHVGDRDGQPAPPAPVAAIMGGDDGFLALVAQPQFKDVPSLRGQTLAVDALTTGYAFALQEVLRRSGLAQGDFFLSSAGGVKQRYDALVASQYAATLLITPFDAMAEAKGLRRLVSVSEELGRYQGLTAAVRTDWAAQHADQVISYIRAYRAALRWLYDPRNKAEAIAIYLQHMPGSTAAQAEAAYALLVRPRRGLQPDAAFDIAGMKTVLALRERYAARKTKLGAVSRYYSTAYFRRASAAVR